MSLDTKQGMKVYTPFALKLYDWWVLKISNQYAWRCDTQKHLLPHFSQHLSKNHLDIGVGTGFYPKRSANQIAQISFSDLNANSLAAAQRVLPAHKIKHCLLQDVFQPFPENTQAHFDSISIFYLLHCLPGTMCDKQAALENIVATLTQDGVLYGATILGEGVRHNKFGQKLMQVYNQKGIFSNRADSEEQLQRLLSALFERVEIRVEGVVALFSASKKRA
ncbi:class I SAM-dependent methyltransferase [Testudinibacter sp. P27/CKL/0425]